MNFNQIQNKKYYKWEKKLKKNTKRHMTQYDAI